MEKSVKIFLICSICLLSCIMGCKKEIAQKTKIAPAFYHWQTHLQISPVERQLMDSLNVKKLYVKFFDIDLNENNKRVPNAVVEIDTHLIDNIEIIPTVFITNRTFKNISQKEIETLADNIFNKINKLSFCPYSEIQFDCDWTQSTRGNYFYFLEKFKSFIHNKQTINNQQITISATIRLHQLKYPDKTGIPPVDKGMLMFYNMGELDNWETENSILDLNIAEQYLIPNTQYPIPLDIALPIFKWGVAFRNNELVYLINNLIETDLVDTARFVKLAENRYGVQRSTYLGGYYLYEGDRVRLEGVSPELLEGAAADLSQFLKLGKYEQEETTLTFYHLDTTTIESFHYKDLKNVLEQFVGN